MGWRLPLAPSTDGLFPSSGDGGLAGLGEVHQIVASALRRRVEVADMLAVLASLQRVLASLQRVLADYPWEQERR